MKTRKTSNPFPQHTQKEHAMKQPIVVFLVAAMATFTLTFATNAEAKTQFDADKIGMEQLEAAAAQCPNGVCPSESLCKAVKKLGRAVKAGCDNLEIPAGQRVKNCNDMITTFSCNSVGNNVITLTQADCDKEGKDLKDGKCVDKPVVALTQADCDKEGKVLRNGKCANKPTVLTQADCEKQGKELKGGKCVQKAVVLTQADCEKDGKDLKDGVCVDKPVVVAAVTCKPNEELAPDGVTCRHLKRPALTQVDCDKRGMDLKDGVCVDKPVVLTQADCDKEGKDLKDGICVPKAIVSLCCVPGWLLPILVVLIVLMLALIAYLIWDRNERSKAEAKAKVAAKAKAEAEAKAKAEAEAKAKAELDQLRADLKTLKDDADAKAKAEAEAKFVKCPKCDFRGPSGKFCPKDGEKLPEPVVAVSNAANLVSRDDLRVILEAFRMSLLNNDVEARCLNERSASFAWLMASLQQLLGKLEAAPEKDEVEIGRLKRMIANLDFLKKEIDSTCEQLLADLKDKPQQ